MTAEAHVWRTNFGTRERVVAARTQREAMEALGLTRGEFRAYAAETWNEVDRGLALSKPGVVFSRSNVSWDQDAYVEEGGRS